MKEKQFEMKPRYIVYCVLIRMGKTKEDMMSIFDINDGNYRTLRSRVRRRLSKGGETMRVKVRSV